MHGIVLRCAALLLFTLSTTLPLMGCGDDGSANQRRRSRRSVKKRKVQPLAEMAAIDESKLPPKLRNLDWNKKVKFSAGTDKSRDPFERHLDDLALQSEEGGQQPVTQIRSAIGSATVEELSLIAIISGTAAPKAMLTDSAGVGHIVKIGDVVGSSPPMRLARITRNEVLFRALEKATDQAKPVEVRKALLTQNELQELLP